LQSLVAAEAALLEMIQEMIEGRLEPLIARLPVPVVGKGDGLEGAGGLVVAIEGLGPAAVAVDPATGTGPGCSADPRLGPSPRIRTISSPSRSPIPK